MSEMQTQTIPDETLINHLESLYETNLKLCPDETEKIKTVKIRLFACLSKWLASQKVPEKIHKDDSDETKRIKRAQIEKYWYWQKLHKDLQKEATV